MNNESREALGQVTARAADVAAVKVKLAQAEELRPGNNPAIEVALQHAANALGEAQWAARNAGATAADVRAATEAKRAT